MSLNAVESLPMKVFRESKDEKNISDFLSPTFESGKYEIFPLAGDASTRRYYRLVQEEKSYVIMAWEPFEDSPQFPFLSVHNLFSKAGVQVPEVIKKSPKLGLMLLEDLGDLTLERKFWENQNQELVIPFYQLAIDELIKIHFATKKLDQESTAFTTVFDKEKLLWEMNYGREHLLEKLCKIQFSESEKNSLTSIFSDICEKLSSQEQYVCHRDYHSRNVMIKFGKMRVIDFQDARMGPIQYDLVSLFKDSYVKLNSQVHDYCIDYYLESAKEHSYEPNSKDEFLNVYQLQSIQRCFKACGSFASFKVNRNDSRYLKYLRRTLKHVRASLEHFSEYKDFNDILENYGLYDKRFEA